MTTRWCPRCRSGYQAWATECIDCHVALVDELPEEQPVDHSVVAYDVADWPDDRRAALDLLLRAGEVVHEWADGELRVPAAHEAEVDALVDSLDDEIVVSDDDVGPLAEEDEVGGGDRIAPPWRRFAGWLVDVAFLSAISGVVRLAAGPLDDAVGTAAYIALTGAYNVVGVAVWGRTVGKRVVGTRVIDAATDRTPRWSTAFVRWLVPTVTLAPDLIASEAAASAIGGLLLIVVYVPILFDDQARGLHDRAARTVVIEG